MIDFPRRKAILMAGSRCFPIGSFPVSGLYSKGSGAVVVDGFSLIAPVSIRAMIILRALNLSWRNARRNTRARLRTWIEIAIDTLQA